MKSRRFICLLVMAGACLLISSCGLSKNPLSDPQKAKPDAQLAGIWRRADPDGAEYYHVGQFKGLMPPGIMRAVSIVHNKDGSIEKGDEHLMFSTTIGKDRYLNVIMTKNSNKEELDIIKDIIQLEEEGWKPELIDGYALVKYEIKGDTLDVWIMEHEEQRRLIQLGKIKGTADDNSAPMFTDTPENLAALLASPDGKDMFGKTPELHVRYERVKVKGE